MIRFSNNPSLLIGITLDPHSYDAGMETFVIYIVSTDGSVSVTYSILLNVSFSFSGNPA